jgi:hypothetical protein
VGEDMNVDEGEFGKKYEMWTRLIRTKHIQCLPLNKIVQQVCMNTASAAATHNLLLIEALTSDRPIISGNNLAEQKGGPPIVTSLCGREISVRGGGGGLTIYAPKQKQNG